MPVARKHVVEVDAGHVLTSRLHGVKSDGIGRRDMYQVF